MASTSVEVESSVLLQKKVQNGASNGINGATNGHGKEAEHEEMQYLNLIKKIIETGEDEERSFSCISS